MPKKQKSILAPWGQITAAELNRLLKPHNVRLVVTHSKKWGEQVNVAAMRIPLVPADDPHQAVALATLADQYADD